MRIVGTLIGTSALVALTALGAGTLATSGGGSAAAAATATATTTKTASPTATATPTATLPAVKPGVVFNMPDVSPLTIQNKIIAALDNAPSKSQIRLMMWNFNAPAVTNALIRAHHRGATVRAIMGRGQVDTEWQRLKNGLQWHNTSRPDGRRSVARTCRNSCRGRGGSEHDKWMSISQSGRSKDIVMEGSFNTTVSAVRFQWNDWYTVVGNQKIYDTYQKIFDQARRDRSFAPLTVTAGNRRAWFSPRRRDIVIKLLDDVRCGGVAKGAGVNGHTRIRIASAVIQQARGEAIARRLKELVHQGCNVRVLYTLSTHTVLGILRGVPFRHMAWDYDGDGAFDRYLHMKAMAISGRVGDDRSAHVVYNGSANWSWMGAVSDEQGFIVQSSGLERRYSRHIDDLWGIANRRARQFPRSVLLRDMRRNGVTDPYAGIRAELRG